MICSNCNNASKKSKVYLETEVDDYGREYAYYLPNNDRVELIKGDFIEYLKNNPSLKITKGFFYHCPRCNKYTRINKACQKCNGETKKRYFDIVYEEKKLLGLYPIGHKEIAFIKPDGEAKMLNNSNST